MFRAPLCPSSGAREYYTGGCCLWYLVLWFSSCRYGVELRFMCPVYGLQPINRVRFTGSAPHHTDNLKTKAPNTTDSNHPYNTLELLMMGIVVPETYWASNKICNKNHLLHLVDILFPHINDDARSKSHQIYLKIDICLRIWTEVDMVYTSAFIPIRVGIIYSDRKKCVTFLYFKDCGSIFFGSFTEMPKFILIIFGL